MYKLLFVFAMIFAVAQAGAILYSSVGHLPYSNGWTDGPNNGVGPVVYANPLGYAGYAGLGYAGVHQIVV